MLATSCPWRGNYRAVTPPLHQPLGTSLVGPTAFLYTGDPLTRLVLEQLRGWGHQGERLPRGKMRWGKKRLW